MCMFICVSVCRLLLLRDVERTLCLCVSQIMAVIVACYCNEKDLYMAPKTIVMCSDVY